MLEAMGEATVFSPDVGPRTVPTVYERTEDGWTNVTFVGPLDLRNGEMLTFSTVVYV